VRQARPTARPDIARDLRDVFDMCSDLALTAVGASFPRFNSTFLFSAQVADLLPQQQMSCHLNYAPVLGLDCTVDPFDRTKGRGLFGEKQREPSGGSASVP
jgi:hypothetical protein